jgi:hypothetical protein
MVMEAPSFTVATLEPQTNVPGDNAGRAQGSRGCPRRGGHAVGGDRAGGWERKVQSRHELSGSGQPPIRSERDALAFGPDKITAGSRTKRCSRRRPRFWFLMTSRLSARPPLLSRRFCGKQAQRRSRKLGSIVGWRTPHKFKAQSARRNVINPLSSFQRFVGLAATTSQWASALAFISRSVSA